MDLVILKEMVIRRFKECKMKALIVNGSPRGKNSNSKIMSDFFEEGLIECGIETESIFLADIKLESCRGCFGCWKNPEGSCVINDEMRGLIEKSIESDYVIFTTPVYFYTMPAVLKNFIDRLLPLATPQIHINDKGEFYHKGRYQKYPKNILLTNCGFPGQGNFDGIKVAFTFLYPVAIICRNQGELLKIKQAPVKKIIDKYGELLKQAAIDLVKNGFISEELEARMNQSLVPDEIYTQDTNRNWG